jgi:hypothetical protein
VIFFKINMGQLIIFEYSIKKLTLIDEKVRYNHFPLGLPVVL